MRLKTVREDYDFFTRATGERTRNLAYGGIGAAWALNSANSTFAPLPLISLICFCAFLALDVFGAAHCAKISKDIILFHEDKVFRDLGRLPDDNYEFDYSPKFNDFSVLINSARPWLAVTGCVPLAIHLIMSCRISQG
jgi:hypothetical protein